MNRRSNREPDDCGHAGSGAARYLCPRGGNPHRTRLHLSRGRGACGVDGDTVDVDIDLGFYVWIKKQCIRVFRIDAPEVTGETRQEGLAATEHLKSLIEGESIILRTVKGADGGNRDDSFGRWPFEAVPLARLQADASYGRGIGSRWVGGD